MLFTVYFLSLLMVEINNTSIIERPRKINSRILFLSFLYFCFIYSFRVPGLPVNIEAYHVVLVGLFIYAFLQAGFNVFRFGKFNSSRSVKKYLLWNVFLIVYISLLFSTIGEGEGMNPLPQFYLMIIILFLFFLSGKYVFGSLYELMLIFYIVGIAQSIIVFASTLFPSFENIMKAIKVASSSYGDNILFDDMIKYSGYHIGLSCFTSQGSLKFAISQISSCYFLIISNDKKIKKHIALFFLITIATSLVARTGFFISLVCLAVVFHAKLRQGSAGLMKYLSIIIISILVLVVFSSIFLSSDFLSNIFVRFTVLFDRGLEGAFLNSYLGETGDNAIPEISPETIIGLGIYGGTSASGIRAVADGGFISNYISFGLIVCVINYIIIFGFFIKSYKNIVYWKYKYIIFFIFCVFLIGEFKERYIYLYYFMCFAFMAFYLIEKEEKIQTYKMKQVFKDKVIK